MDFSIPESTKELLAKYEAFLGEHAYPLEAIVGK